MNTVAIAFLIYFISLPIAVFIKFAFFNKKLNKIENKLNDLEDLIDCMEYEKNKGSELTISWEELQKKIK